MIEDICAEASPLLYSAHCVEQLLDLFLKPGGDFNLTCYLE